MDSRLRWVVFTGGSGGIGRSTVGRVLANSFGVVSRSCQLDVRGAAIAEGQADRVRLLRWDLSDADSIQQYADQIIPKVGPVAGLVHCADAQLAVSLGVRKPSVVLGLFAINTFAAMELVPRHVRLNAVVPRCSRHGDEA
jgi:NAD(P)-dependent dehydrogenase (short-subunit alcohol dehydrogenase family)